MRKKRIFLLLSVISLALLQACKSDEENPSGNCDDDTFFCEYSSRDFEMGFSTWAYAPTLQAVDDTYEFIGSHADVYSEHIDSSIPWDAWINDSPLPSEFTNEIAARAARKIAGAKLTVSVSPLNIERTDLAFDFDGTVPDYQSMDDQEIVDAYFNHLRYITNQLDPDYLLIAIEVNELLKNTPEKWDDFKSLMANVKIRIQQQFPSLTLSESITLHNLYEPDVPNPETYIDEVVTYANAMDLVTISFYPFFKGLDSRAGFQNAFDFLHGQITKPIAFSETGHLSEDLSVESFNLFIPGNPSEQNEYLETLLTNAQEENYQYVIWWTHRDYDELWETFPDDVKDLGKLWISTGIVNEDGSEKEAYSTWETVVNR